MKRVLLSLKYEEALLVEQALDLFVEETLGSVQEKAEILQSLVRAHLDTL